MEAILIVSALREESLHIIKRLNSSQINGSPYIYISSLDHKTVYWLITGMGKKNVQFNLKYFLTRYKVSRILSIGVSGGVSTDLAFGDLVVQDTSSILDSNKKLAPISFSHDFLQDITELFKLKSIPYSIKHGLTVDYVIDSPKAKEQLSHLPVSLIDMESYYIAELAHSSRISAASVRFILDPYNESILDLSPFIQDDGTIRLRLLLIELLKKPRIGRDLYQLHKKMIILKRKQWEAILSIIQGVK